MIQATQLRIGNFIAFGKQCCKVYEIQENCFYVIGEKERSFKSTSFELEPIPLTEDWLIKFGFEKIIDNEFTLRYELKKDPRFDYFFPKHNLKTFGLRFQGCTFFDVVKYVHQLQNLYFALTNKELNYETTTI